MKYRLFLLSITIVFALFLSISAYADGSDIHEGYKIPEFNTIDIKGRSVDSSIFKNKDLTILNIWGTFCGPCIEEMPELARWSAEMDNRVQIIGLILDVNADDAELNKEQAANLLKVTNADYVNILPNKDLQSFTEKIEAVPTTIFVDSKGCVVGEPIIGNDVSAYKQFVKDYFDENAKKQSV